jgi:hypothetical protein
MGISPFDIFIIARVYVLNKCILMRRRRNMTIDYPSLVVGVLIALPICGAIGLFIAAMCMVAGKDRRS